MPLHVLPLFLITKFLGNENLAQNFPQTLCQNLILDLQGRVGTPAVMLEYPVGQMQLEFISTKNKYLLI